MNNLIKNYLSISIMLPALLLPVILSGCATGCQQAIAQQGESDRIKATIKARISAEKELKNTSIIVNTLDHTVQLSGYVHTNAQQLLAVQIAMDVEGVARIDNALILKKMIKKHKKHEPSYLF